MHFSIQQIYKIMNEVGRRNFLPSELKYLADIEEALPIGHDQTISQPYIVAFMTAALSPDKDDKVLEIGTGSGFQAAVLAKLAHKIYTVEIIKTLADEARERLFQLGYENVFVQHGDGYWGWNEQAPYDCIIVTACAETVPQTLIDQLKLGGRMIIPVGPVHGAQSLVLIQKDEAGVISSKNVLAVRFVPFTRNIRL
ncbi:protein-L-isoaspartate(D-aspartate) O-methyltransferase [Parabacteroides sp. FAFU027]|uniref:protein-L-isoaspartate(D-aspartate) O-methyltransferase n=1 Tax=Parabacteroides sp. FAFU027 TaxID=2922715 RepID=UPI001FAFC329|nr:protein-L-isoaspartate(D-aspartate) O-methyltransferase [Parabacteroides sp. FAFU027]